MSESSKRYQMIVGGITELNQDGTFRAAITPFATYSNLDYAQQQGIVRALSESAEVQSATAELAAAVGEVLIGLGDAYGIATGEVTKAEIDLVKKLK